MPVVKLESVQEVTRTSNKGRKYGVVEVAGTLYGSGKPWKTDIFKNQKDLIQTLNDEFAVGELVSFVFTKNGRWWDLVSIEQPTAELLEGIDKGEIEKTNQNNGGSGWNGRTGEQYDRSASIYLAFDMIKSVETEANLRKHEEEELLARTMHLATMINQWIHQGNSPFIVDESPDTNDDSLTPPGM